MKLSTFWKLEIPLLLALTCSTGNYFEGVEPEPVYDGAPTLVLENDGPDVIVLKDHYDHTLARVYPGHSECVILELGGLQHLYVVIGGMKYEGPVFNPWDGRGGWWWKIGSVPRLDVTLNLVPGPRCEAWDGM